MTKTLTKDSVLGVIADEKLGFKFGAPERPGGEDSLAVIVPILRETSTKRQYKTFPETDKVLITDSGSINTMNVENTDKDHVFMRSGTIFAGKTQERAMVRSAVLIPGQKAALEVRCVHASKGIRSGAEVKYGGVTPLSMDQTVYGRGFTPHSQAHYWSEVTSYTANLNQVTGKGMSSGPTKSVHNVNENSRMYRSAPHVDITERDLSCSFLGNASTPLMGMGDGPSAGHDDLSSHLNNLSKDLDEILSKVALHDNQVGFALITDSGCQTIESFDVGESWAAIHKDAAKRVGVELATKAKESVFEYKPEKAKKVIQEVLATKFEENRIYEHKPTNGDFHILITGLTSSDYVGEVVELDGKVIHLVILKRNKKN